jgi:hypothetical protein
MTRHSKAPLGDGALPDQITAGAGSSAVCVCDNTTFQFLPSNLKAGIVTVLSWILAWRLTLAICLGRLVLRVWPNFRRA